MIDQQLLESAIAIRRKFLKLDSEMDKYKKDVEQIMNFLQEKMKNLEGLIDNKIKKIRNEQHLESVSRDIIKEIDDIEFEEKKLQKKVENINIELEKLSKEEEVLYDTIRSRYPELTDNQIIKEIHKNL
jgi:seryl-tRNA synthetase